MASNSTSSGLDSLRYPSWCLSRMLDEIVGTEEQIILQRKCWGVFSYIIDKGIDAGQKFLFSGSRGEGFSFKSSDADLMFIDPQVVVIDVIHNTEVTEDHRTVLTMRRNGCNPGFVILELRNRTNNGRITESLVDYQGSPVVSSILYRDVHNVAEIGQVGHGPCNTFNGTGTDVDIAQCFECKRWPSEANEFIHRSRPYGWPKTTLLDKIRSRGCHLVPIGDKDNELSYIQWRLSFSAAEKDLVHSFTHTQFRVYGALKIFLKQFVSQIKHVEDLLCSYFLKTVLFYSIETTPASFWREDLLIPCFWFCVNKLVKHIEDGYLPNYFIPQNNMFRNKVSGKNQRNLLLVFDQVKRMGWSCIYLCEDFRSLQTFVRFPESILQSTCIYTIITQECRLDGWLKSLTTNACKVILDDTRVCLSRVLTLVRYARSQSEEDISMLNLYGILGYIGKFYFCNSINVNNKVRFKLLSQCGRYLLASLKGDFSTGHLNLATFFYQTGQYNKVIHECRSLIAQWKPFVLYSHKQSEVLNMNVYHRYFIGHELTGLVKARAAWSYDVTALKQFKTFYPSDLCYDIEANGPFGLRIPPLPYAVFLSFLCHHKLGNINDSLAALHHLKILVNDEQQGCRHYPIVLNLLAICLHKVGDIPGATDACFLSWRIKPERNGAGKLLAKILRENS